MTDRTLLRSPFGTFYGGTRPTPSTRINHKRFWCKSANHSSSIASQSIYLLDPPPTILRLVEQCCLTEYPNRYYLTSWQAPGGIRHTKISFLVGTAEEALRLLQTAAQAWEQQSEYVWL